MIKVTLTDDLEHFTAPDSRTFELRDLNNVAELIDSLRTSMIFEHDEFDGMTRYAEQHFLTALSHMDIAMRHFKMGWMEQRDDR